MKNKFRNNKFIVSLLLLCALCSLGCSKDFLNTEIDVYQTPQSLATNPTIMFSFANAFYTQLQWGYTALDNNLFAAASDEMQETVVTGNTVIFNVGALSANSNPDAPIFKKYYDGIRAANFFLDYSKNYYTTLSNNYDTVSNALPFAQNIQNAVWFRAEAHVARAYYYGELIKRYGGVPIINQTQQTVSLDSMYVGQQSYDSCVNYIVNEIDSNKSNLQVNWKTSQFANYDGRFTLGSALAIKARVLLFAASPLHNPTNDPAKWIRAANALNDLITANNTLGLGYTLESSYAKYFDESSLSGASMPQTALSLSSNETILALRSSASTTIESRNYPPLLLTTSPSPLCPSDNLVADYEYINKQSTVSPYMNRDPRLAASIIYNGSIWCAYAINEQAGPAPYGGAFDPAKKAYSTKTGYYLKKFLCDNASFINGAAYTHVWVLFRWAEVLLEYAEALNEAYGPDVVPAGFTMSARQAIMLVRNRASTRLPSIATAVTTDQMRPIIKHERRIELAFEDYRYWDLLRWGSSTGVAKDSIDASVVLNGPIYGMQIGTNPTNNAATYTRVVVGSRTFHAPTNYYYPFAYGDIINSKNKIIQNPGY